MKGRDINGSTPNFRRQRPNSESRSQDEQRLEMLRTQMEQLERSQQEREQCWPKRAATFAENYNSEPIVMLTGRTLAELLVTRQRIEARPQAAAGDELRRGRQRDRQSTRQRSS
jgi:hypothetical protein